MRKQYQFTRPDDPEGCRVVTIWSNGKKHARAKALVQLCRPGEDPDQVVVLPVLPVKADTLLALTNEARREARVNRLLQIPDLPVGVCA